jgi:hypothetical protein
MKLSPDFCAHKKSDCLLWHLVCRFARVHSFLQIELVLIKLFERIEWPGLLGLGEFQIRIKSFSVSSSKESITIFLINPSKLISIQ